MINMEYLKIKAWTVSFFNTWRGTSEHEYIEFKSSLVWVLYLVVVLV
jgi:hypothetical protein